MKENDPLMIFHDFEGNSSESQLSEWPFHFTVTPFFTLEAVSQDAAVERATEIIHGVGKFEIQPGDHALYGPNNDIPVTKVLDASGELHRLHMSLVLGLGELGCRFSDLTYALENYSPHITHKSSFVVPESAYQVNSISIAKKFPKTSIRNKVILQKIDNA